MNDLIIYRDFIANSYSDELKLIISLVSGIDYKIEWNNINWDKFIKLSLKHRLYPFYKYSDISIPESVINELRLKHQQNTMRILPMVSELIRINKVFQEYDIEVIWMKGPVLSQKLYNNVNTRIYNDLDVLIDIENFQKVQEIMLCLGYELTNLPSELNFFQKKILFHFRNQIDFFNKNNNTTVEIHWRLTNPKGLYDISFQNLLSSAENEIIAGEKIPTLGKENYLLYLMTHCALHQWVLLSWLKDIDSFIMKYPINFEILFNEARKWRLEKIVYQSLVLSNIIFNTRLPEKHEIIKDSLYKKFINTSLKNITSDKIFQSGSDISKFRHVFDLMKLSKSLSYKLNALFKIFINTDDWKNIRLPLLLFPIYFIIRPFTWFAKTYLNKK
jgi:hypothetical protein